MGKAGAGYRKPKTKKYFTKKDIISTSIVAAIVIVAIIVLSIVIKNDDFIRVVDGKLQMEDNWIISNYSDSGKYMYYKLGEIGDVEGYTLGAGSAQSAIKVITADDENADITNIYIGTFEHNYATAAEAMATYYADTYGPIDVTVAGHNAKYITSFSPASAEEPSTEEVLTEMVEAETAEEPAAEETAAEETASEETSDDAVEVVADQDIWVMIAYVDYDEDHCIYIQFNADRELTPEEGEAFLYKVAESLTLVER